MASEEQFARLRVRFETASPDARDEFEAWLIETVTFQARAAAHPEIHRRVRHLDD